MEKLVRDKIPQIIADNNQIRKTRKANSDEEFWKFLKEKLLEEVDEFLEATNDKDAQEEMADIFEVIDAICGFKGYSKENIERCKANKKDTRGGFKKRIILSD